MFFAHKSMLLVAFLLSICLVSVVRVSSDGEINQDILERAFDEAHAELLIEHKTLKLNKVSISSSHVKDAASLHLSLSATSPVTQLIHNSFKLALKAAQKLKTSQNLTSTHLLKLKSPPKFCPFNSDIFCEASSKYRQIDGSCNNLANGMLGRGNTPFKRLIKPAYDDKIEEPRRTSVTGEPLPNPRSVSLAVHDPLDLPTVLSNLGVMFGQFIDHDLALTATTGVGSSPFKCSCGSTNSDCVNIPTPSEDSIDSDQDCQVLTRSGASFEKLDCSFGAREQTNINTHWLDMSHLYGNDQSQMTSLRSFRNGRLKTTHQSGSSKDFLPFAPSGTCVDETDEQMCFESGDSRTSQNMMLVGIHTVWLREHNRIARQLQRLNPSWTDDDLYQETKRIITAMYHNILYGEWLPIILGQRMIRENDLMLKRPGEYHMNYDESTNPHISAEFSTAAYRFGHTLLRSTLSKSDDSLNQFSNLTLSDIMLRPTEAFSNGGLDSICRGLLVDTGTSFDTHFTDQVQHHLFETGAFDAQTKRFSLSAINIMRGRDHGLAPYNEFRAFVNLSRAKSFDDLLEIPPTTRDKLRQVYKDVNDIDAYTGGTGELPVDGSILGPTFATIVAKQFRDLKVGDRFYFENGHDKATRFSIAQLDEIRKSSMARIYCDNLDIRVIQKSAFRAIGADNPLVPCSTFRRMDLSLWKNEPLKLDQPPEQQQQQQDPNSNFFNQFGF